VGGANFKSMEILDADDKVLKDTRGRIMDRDIVQFVPFRRFANAPPHVLAKETLAELPGQV
jgi:hypothetical protein